MGVNRWLTAVRMRLRSLVRLRTAERELNEELQFHVEQATAENIARGMKPAAARRAALLAMGGLDQHKEDCREARGLTLLRSMGRDGRLAVRLLRRQPAFSAVVVLTLSAGVGALISVVTVGNWLLARPLAGVGDPASLVGIRLDREDLSSAAGLSLEDVEIIVQRAPSLHDVAGVDDALTDVAIVLPDQSGRRVGAEFVMANYFAVIGTPIDGRAFTLEEEQAPGAAAVVILSERLAALAGGGAIVGRTVIVNGTPAVVAGVVRHGYRGLKRLRRVDVWMPLAQRWVGLPPGIDRPERIGPRAALMRILIGRRDPDLPIAVVQEQLTAVEQQIAAGLPATSTRFATRHLRADATFERFPSNETDLRRLFRVMIAAAGLLLVLACANASNALLARSTARTGELATRLALGASRGSLARALLAEGLVLSIVASLVGVGMAMVVAWQLEGASLAASMPPMERPALDWRVIVGCALLCLVVAAGASLAAMWSVRRASVSAALQKSSRSVSSGKRRLMQGLTAAQVAISVVLLIGATMLVRTVDAALSIDVGFDRASVQTFRLDPHRLPGPPSLSFREELIERLRAVPGVAAATVAFLPPFYSGVEARLVAHADGMPDGTEDHTTMLNAVHPGFFETIGVPLVAGRDFARSDLLLPAGEAPLILGESVARALFGESDAVGRFVVPVQGGRREVIGVVRDSRQRQVASDDTTALAFQPHLADYRTPFITGIVRTATPDVDIWPDVRRVLTAMDRSLVLFDARSVDEGIRTEVGSTIMTMRLALIFGAAAVALAASGLASVLARALAERRRELGIRTALGATPARLVALVGRQSIAVLVIGLAAGTLAAITLTRYIEGRLYGISRLDSASFVVGIALVTVVMTAASIPACRRAARVEPAETLKES